MRGETPKKDRATSIVGMLVFWCLFLWWPQTTNAYVPTYTDKSKKPVRWINTNCVPIHIDSLGRKYDNTGACIAAIKRAMDNWHKAAGNCSYLRFVPIGPKGRAQPSFVRGQNHNVIVFVHDHWVNPYAEDPRDERALALTLVQYIDKPNHPQDGRILDTDMEINEDGFVFFSSTAADVGIDTASDLSFDNPEGSYDLESVITHELGHVAGLDHPCWKSDDKGAMTPDYKPPVFIDENNETGPAPACKDVP